jgi:GGDEF domain-containing protein
MSKLREALNSILAVLKHEVNLDLWMVTRVVDNDWIMLSTTENSYGVNADDVKVWSDSVCTRMVALEGPNIVPCVSEVISYASAPIVGQLNFQSYVGFPLTSEDGEVIGTLCAIDPAPKEPSLVNQAGLMRNFVIVVESLLRQSQEINRLNTLLRDYLNTENVDNVLGLPNQTAFYQIAEQQKAELHNLGSPLAIVLVEVQRFAPEFSAPDIRSDGLMSVKETILEHKRETDILCKLNGDNFGLLLIDADNKVLISIVIKTLKALQLKGFKVSVGAHVCGQNEDINSAIKHAKERAFE